MASIKSIEEQATLILRQLAAEGGFPSALVCTEDGLPVAVTGSIAEPDDLSAFVSLFDTVVQRAERDVKMDPIDEVTLLPSSGIRLILRPIVVDNVRFFLVIRAPRASRWRRRTNRAVQHLSPLLTRLLCGVPE